MVPANMLWSLGDTKKLYVETAVFNLAKLYRTI